MSTQNQKQLVWWQLPEAVIRGSYPRQISEADPYGEVIIEVITTGNN